MKRILLATVCLVSLLNSDVMAQRKCGFSQVMDRAVRNDPSFLENFRSANEESKMLIDEISSSNVAHLAKSTSTPVIPVVFHIILNSTQIAQLGGTAGIARRVDSQMKVINRDFNKQNFDSTLIPATFKTYYGNINIRFSLAHRTPTNQSTPGWFIKTITGGGFNDISNAYATAKYNTSGGDNAWDPTKYLNIWVIATTDGQGILGVTTPPGFGPTAELGVVLNYQVFGKRSQLSDYYVPSTDDKGRTLTHELGHYFELWHIWGDDGGDCPGTGGYDDGISDTPPQADATYSYQNPSYPEVDGCTGSTPGIMFMNFMDYVDDGQMQMFTKQQAIKANQSLNANSLTLTQHPEVLQWPTDVATFEVENAFDIYPNPTSGKLNVSFAGVPSSLKNISVTNVVGQTIYTQNADANTAIYNIDISGISKGVYFVQCHFAEGMVTRKIVLE